MTLNTYPSDLELLALYADVLGDVDVAVVSQWKETNHDGPFDEEAYLAKATADAPAFAAKMREVLAGIQ